MNVDWHKKHNFPKEEGEEKKNEWRKEHRKNCDCGRKRLRKS